jgi:hypothetical protein
MLSNQSKRFVAITKHLCGDDPSKDDLVVAKAKERRSKPGANLAKIKSQQEKME